MADHFTIEKEHGTYQCYIDYVVGYPKEGTLVRARDAKELFDLLDKYYGKPYVYIADRVEASSRDYSVFPFMKKNIPSSMLLGIAIVVHSGIGRVVADNEAAMMEGVTFEVFKTLNAAKEWAAEVLEGKA